MSSSQADNTVPTLDEATRAAKDALRDVGRKASSTFNDLSNEACESSSRARDEIVRRVEAQPLTAVLLAAGVGLLAGLLWAHR